MIQRLPEFRERVRRIDNRAVFEVIELLARLPGAHLVVVGSGPWLERLQSLAQSLGVQDRVTFAGLQANDRLKTYYSASDALVLASSREGWANVLLEAMACGCPAISTPAGGSPEVVTDQSGGIVTDGFSTDAIKQAIMQLRQRYPSREAVYSYAKNLSWQQSIELLKSTFDRYASKIQARQYD